MANSDAHMPDNVFVGAVRAEDTVAFAVSDRLNAAMDLLADAEMLDEKRMRMLVLCETTRAGDPFDRNPEALARKLVRLNAAVRGT